MLFFAGGGGSVRGYAYRSIGVENIHVPGEEPFVVGGKGLIEGSGELRYRFNPSWGGGRLRRLRDRHRELGLERRQRLAHRRRPRRALLHQHRHPARRPRDPGQPAPRRLAGRALHRHRAGVLKRVAAIFALLLLVAIAAVAQDAGEPDSDNGFLLNLLENRLSAPGRQIRLSGVSGALSSQARIARITISDDKGPWLQVDNAQLDWSRLALLRGRVDINRLSAERIAWLRKAETPPPARSAAAGRDAALRAARAAGVDPGARARGRARSASRRTSSARRPTFGVTGNVSLAGGALELGARRSSGSTARAARSRSRPPSPTRPASSTSTSRCRSRRAASSPRCSRSRARRRSTSRCRDPARSTTSTSTSASTPARTGSPRAPSPSAPATTGSASTSTSAAACRRWCPQQFRDFFAGQSTVKVTGVKKSAGGLRIDQLTLAGAVLHLDGGLETGNDGFLRDLALTGSLGDPAGPAVLLPVPGGRTSLHSAELYVDFGGGSRWSGFVALDRLKAADIEMEDVTLRLGGLAQNLEDPARRNVTVNVEGLATGVWAPEPEVARALGSRIDLFADAALPPGGPLTLRQFQLSGNGLSIFTAGELREARLHRAERRAVSPTSRSSPGSPTARSRARSTCAPTAASPRSAAASISPSRAAPTTSSSATPGSTRCSPARTALSGRAVRDEAGIRTEDLRIANPQLSFASNGQISSTADRHRLQREPRRSRTSSIRGSRGG